MGLLAGERKRWHEIAKPSATRSATKEVSERNDSITMSAPIPE